jgi:hypothetical protein
MLEFACGIPAFPVIETGPTITVLLYRTFTDVRLRDPPLVAFHLILALVFYLLLSYRKSVAKSTALFGLICLLIAATPSVNSFMRSHWASFLFSADYFDSTQLFIFLFFCAPLLIVAVVFLLLLVIDAITETGNSWLRGGLMRFRQRFGKSP